MEIGLDKDGGQFWICWRDGTIIHTIRRKFKLEAKDWEQYRKSIQLKWSCPIPTPYLRYIGAA